MRSPIFYVLIMTGAIVILFMVNNGAFIKKPTNAATDLNVESQEQITKIDAEINQITQKLTSLKLKEMNAEMKAQPELRQQPSKFTTEMKSAETDDEQARKLQERLQQLYDKKKELLQQSSQ